MAVEGAARSGIEAKARREDRRRELLEEGVVLQVHAQAQKDVEPEVEHHDLARLRLRVGRETVQVVRPQEADAAGFEVLPLAVHAMLQPPSGHEEDFREVVRVQHRPRLRHAVEVEVAARLEVFEAPSGGPRDLMAADPRVEHGVQPALRPLPALHGLLLCSDTIEQATSSGKSERRDFPPLRPPKKRPKNDRLPNAAFPSLSRSPRCAIMDAI